MKQLVGIDIDGVLADFTNGWRTLAHTLLGQEFVVYGNGAQQTWDWPITAEQRDLLWDTINASHSWWTSLEPVVTYSDVEALHALSAEFDLVYVTSRKDYRSPNLREQTEWWLRRHRLPAYPVRFTDDKVAFYQPYSDQLRAHLDDSPDVLGSMGAAGLPVYVRDWPYNREVRMVRGRVGSVSEFCGQLLGWG